MQMKKLAVLFAFLLTFQFINLCSSRIPSASTNLPIGTSGILPAHKLALTFPHPNLVKRLHQWQFHNPKLDSQLNFKIEKALLENFEESQTSTNSVLSQTSSLAETICVQVKCAAEHLNTIEKKIVELNGTVTGHNSDKTTIQTLIPLASLNFLADLQNVNFVKTPDHAITYTGNYVTEALEDINANNWHNAGVYGQNTRIGVVDVGFSGYNALMGSDLPATVTARNFVDGETSAQLDSGSPHGTACAEVIHDVAPQAAIYLAKIYTNIDLQEAVEWLHSTCNVDIISTSLGWYNLTPGDGTGELAELVSSAYNDGILWVTAAGNDQQRHWGGNFYDPDNDSTHNFTNDQVINYFGPGDGSAYLVDPGINLTIFARWSDWQDVDQDYDLYVYRWNGSAWEGPIASSVNFQNGTAGQTPTEAAGFTTYGTPAAYGFIVYKAFDAAKIVNFEIFAPYAPRLDKILTSRSLPNLADAARATTVSAINTTTFIRQEYSSEGPANGPGGIATGGLGKPDIAAYTNVTTSSFGPLGFSGTSAATPHVAGTAALILSDNPYFTPAQLQSSLANQAFDIENPGFDNTTGWGRLHLDDPGLPSCTPPTSIFVPANDTDGFFQINWGASATYSSTYLLEEATDSSFSNNLRVAYSGIGFAANISSKTNGIYYYRVKAVRDQYNDSSWTTGSNGCSVSINTVGTATWTGYSTSWNSTSNWSSNAVPNNTTSVIVPSTPAGSYWPLISGTLSQAKELTLSGPLTITYGSLTIGN